MAFSLGPDRRLDLVVVIEGVVSLRFARSDQLDRVADVLSNAQLGLEMVNFKIGVGKAQAAGLMEGDSLASDRF